MHINFIDMKKIFLLHLLIFSILSCSTDDTDENDSKSRTTDPIIGTWLEVDDSDPSTLVFSSNGNYTESDSESTYSATWVNNGNDFDSPNQTYIISTEDQSFTRNILFSEDFNSFSFTGRDNTYRRQ